MPQADPSPPPPPAAAAAEVEWRYTPGLTPYPEALAQMELLRQSRLSVAPVRDEEWRKILVLAG